MSGNAAGPLADITVVTLEQAVSAPMCTRTLADFGARVIKVENPRGGDFARNYDNVVQGMAAHFVWMNRGKESVTLDLKTPEGLAVIHRLLDDADVFVSNMAPGATTALGLGPDDLATRHPAVIAMSIDGYGTGGPLSHKRAYDLLIQAESGACATTGLPGAPAKPGPPIADVCSGLYAALSILAVLHERRGQRDTTPVAASVSLFDTMTELMGYALNYTNHTGIDQEPVGMGSPAVAPYGAYPTSDGLVAVLGTTNDREWDRLARTLLGRNDLADDTRFTTNSGRVHHRDELDEVLRGWCAEHTLADIQEHADAAGIGNARYNRPSDVVAHPHLTSRDRWRDIDTPGGPVPALLPPPVIAGREPAMGAVPSLGEHTESVLGDFGFDTRDITRLQDKGAFGFTDS